MFLISVRWEGEWAARGLLPQYIELEQRLESGRGEQPLQNPMYSLETAQRPEQGNRLAANVHTEATRPCRFGFKKRPGFRSRFSAFFRPSDFGLWIFTAALALCVLLFPHPLNAAAPAPSNRFLLIVETSRSMQRRSDGVLKTVKDLLGTGMHGQLQPGDSLGLWTYNKELYAGRFPLQHWTLENTNAVLDRAVHFLEAQKYEKQGQLKAVVPLMVQVVRDSAFITVILISDGAEDLHGTPFDEKVNNSYKAWRTKQQAARMPLVTIFSAQRGHLTDCAVNPAPWPAELPPLSKELLALRQPKPPPEPAKARLRILPPLIVSGKKPEPASMLSPAEVSTGNPATLSPPVPTSGAETPQLLAQANSNERGSATAADAPEPAPAAVGGVLVSPTISQKWSSAEGATGDGKTKMASTDPVPTAVIQTKASQRSMSPEHPATLAGPPTANGGTPQALAPSASPGSVSPRPAAGGAAQPIPASGYATSVSTGLLASPAAVCLAAFGGCACLAAALWYRRGRAPTQRVSLITRSLDQNVR
jgi:hypothetical protein